jgi:outer membrane protein
MKRCICWLTIIFFAINAEALFAQARDSVLENATMQNCVQYALTHQPRIQQSILDEEITERQIKGKLADWYPQINLNYSYQHNFHVQTAVIGGNPIKLGVNNTSSIQFGVTQNIFDRDVLLASHSAEDVRTQVKQVTTSNRIDVVINVSKAFYDVLLTQKQIDLLNDDIVRLERSLKDAYNQYKGGIVDKTDYKRATISLNNAHALKRQQEELLKSKYAFLKEQMGYANESPLDLKYDSSKMESEAYIDTTQNINYESRIEYQLLQTQKKLQQDNLKYYKWSYIPSLSAYGNYNLNFQNDQASKLYSQNYPNSYAGLALSFPIFQGSKRIHEVKQAELELKRVDYDLIALKNAVNTEYTQAMGAYKSSFTNYTVLKENLALAEDVYNTLQLQYKAGIKAYLEVIIAQSDLIQAQLTYTNALFNVLSSKLDVQRALGIVQY